MMRWFPYLPAVAALAVLGCRSAAGGVSDSGVQPAGNQRTSAEAAFRALRPGMVFPFLLHDESGEWTVLQVSTAVSKNSVVVDRDAPCQAYAIALHQTGSKNYVLGLSAVFSKGEAISFEQGPFEKWVIRTDPVGGTVALKVFFADAIRPGQDVLQIREIVDSAADGTVTIMEYVFAAHDTVLKKVLRTCGADPASYAGERGVTFIMKQTAAIRQRYSSGFPGVGYPRDFVYGYPLLLPDATLMPTDLHARWSEPESRFVEEIPEFTKQQQAQFDAAVGKELAMMCKSGQLSERRCYALKRVGDAGR